MNDADRAQAIRRVNLIERTATTKFTNDDKAFLIALARQALKPPKLTLVDAVSTEIIRDLSPALNDPTVTLRDLREYSRRAAANAIRHVNENE
jgi:hypothetical protein